MYLAVCFLVFQFRVQCFTEAFEYNIRTCSHTHHMKTQHCATHDSLFSDQQVSEGRDWTYSIFQPFEGYTPVPLEPAAALSADANGLVVTEDGAKVTCYTSPASENIKVRRPLSCWHSD